MELYPHQAAAVEKMHNGCVLTGLPGTGKSVTAIDYYFHKACGGTDVKTTTMRTPMDLFVITTAKKRDDRDWERDAAHYSIFTDAENHPQGVRVVVDSWNNIKNYTGVENAFFIFDEQRVVGSGAWTRAFVKIAKNNKWVMLSATPGDTWLDYIPVFVANGFYKNRTEFLREHVVYNSYAKFPKVDRYLNPGKLVKHRNSVLVPMPYLSHTIWHEYEIQVPYDQTLFEEVSKKRWHVYENRPLRDVAELFAVMRKVVNSDSSRLKAVHGLLQTHPKLIVFYNFNYELEALRTLAPVTSTVSTAGFATTSGAHSDGKPSSANTSTLLPSSAIGSGAGSTGSGSTKTVAESSSPSPVATSTASAAPAETRGKECLTTNQEASWSTDSSSPTTPCMGTSVSGKTSGVQDPKTRLAGSKYGEKTGAHTKHSLKPSTFAVAEWNGHKHEPIPTTDSWVYLVQYAAGSEGWNCIETDAVCFYSLTYSYKMWRQAHGRIDRLNTPFVHLHYYRLISRSILDRAIWAALKTKRSFNENRSGLFQS